MDSHEKLGGSVFIIATKLSHEWLQAAVTVTG